MGPLIGAVLLLCLAAGRWTIPAAVWLAPLFLLRFLRGRPAPAGIAAAGLVFYATQAFAWRGLVPVPRPLYFVIMLMIAMPSFAPYVVDRLLAPRVRGFASTFVFPCAWVAAEFLTAAMSPYGTWGSAAYTQADALPLIQLVSVTGLSGVGFLIAWFGAVANWAWEHRSEATTARRGAMVYGIVLALVLLWGGARARAVPSATEVVRVASFTQTPRGIDPGDLLGRRREGGALDSLRASLGALHDTLFDWARREARAGARLVTWSETNFIVLKDDEAAELARGAELARQEGITLAMALATFTPGAGYYENQLAVFDPSGTLVARYHKARPVPMDPERGADREIPVFETPAGRVAGAICFDMDFPGLIHKAGRRRAGLILAPSSDWREIDPIHTRMALFRGIENGCSVVRQTNKGLSAATDDCGRVLASVDFFRTRPHVMVAQVPVRSRRTVYALMGDWFAFVCIAALIGLAAVAGGSRPLSVSISPRAGRG